MFLILLIFIPITIFGLKTENLTRIFGIFTSIMCFVISPIFLLYGDINFRKRTSDQGIWKALKKELFSNNTEIQPVNWFFKFGIKAHNQLYSCLAFTPARTHSIPKYSQVPIKRVGPNKRVGWIFIKYFCLSLCLFLSSCFLGAK